MIKVLVANSDKNMARNFCEYLSTFRELKIFGTSTGITTLNTYLEIKPDIFILNMKFDDMNGNEILDKLSLSILEKKKCNTIITTNNLKEYPLIKNTSKVYKIIYKPTKQQLLDIINQLRYENKYVQLNMNDVEEFLIDLGFHLMSKGTNYMKSAIQLCFYFPKYLSSLDSILDYVAKENNTSPYNVRNALRASLKPLNNYISIYNYNEKSVYNLFNKNINITPKTFIEKTVTYFHRKLEKRNKY